MCAVSDSCGEQGQARDRFGARAGNFGAGGDGAFGEKKGLEFQLFVDNPRRKRCGYLKNLQKMLDMAYDDDDVTFS